MQRAYRTVLWNCDPIDDRPEFLKFAGDLLDWSWAKPDYFSERPSRIDRLEYMARNAIKSLVLHCSHNRNESLILPGLYPTSLPRNFQFLASHVKILKLNEHGFEKWPHAINDLAGLTELFISGGKLADLTDMGEFQNLKVLCLARNKLTSLKGLNAPKLEELDVYGNKLQSLYGLPSLPKLKKLSVNVNPFPKISLVAEWLTQDMFPSLDRGTVINEDLKKQIKRRGSEISRLLNIRQERDAHAQKLKVSGEGQDLDVEDEKSQDPSDNLTVKKIGIFSQCTIHATRLDR